MPGSVRSVRSSKSMPPKYHSNHVSSIMGSNYQTWDSRRPGSQTWDQRRSDPGDYRDLPIHLNMYPTGKGSVSETHLVPNHPLHVYREEGPRWSWCSTGWSFFSMIFCGCCFGFVGLIYSILSYVDHKARDFDRSRFKRRCAWCWAITGLILGILWIVVLIVLYFTLPGDIVQEWSRKFSIRIAP